MNRDKLKKMEAQVRIGGKGTPRRKKKVVHPTVVDDKLVQVALKKIGCDAIPNIEEVNMIKEDGTVIHFNNPKVQAAFMTNTISVSGLGENRQINEMLPGLADQLGPEGVNQLKRIVSKVVGSATRSSMVDKEELPERVLKAAQAAASSSVPKK